MAKIDRMALEQKINALDLDNESKSQLLELLRERKKYGIVWEEHPEDVEDRLRSELPVLVEDKDKAIISEDKDAPNHILIEGDNLEALTALSYTHEGKIDVIYIDPPYNTGNKDFVYNDSYVDTEDQYRHSKWLSFMAKRLKIAKRLLKDDGVIFISIDDNEYADLKLLCDDGSILGEQNFVTSLHIEMSATQGMKVKAAKMGNIVKNAEYILVYKKGGDKKIWKQPLLDPVKYDNHYMLFLEPYEGYYKERSLVDVIQTNREIMIELELLNLLNKKHKLSSDSISNAYERSPKFKNWIHENANAICRAHDSIEIADDVKKNLIINCVYKYNSENREYLIVKNEREEVYQRICLSDKLAVANDFYETFGPTRIRGDWWAGFYLDMGNVSKEGGVEYKNGKKPVRLIEQIIRYSSNESSTILDFFAGSGTTLHATLKANNKDGGNRKCITIQGFEKGKNICEEVTYPREKNVIKNEYQANTLRYYRTDFVARESSSSAKRDLMYAAADMLCIKNDIYTEQKQFGSLRFRKDVVRYFADRDKQMLVIYNPDAIEAVVEEIKKMDVKSPIITYVFSLNDYAMDADFEDVAEKVSLCALPSAILNAYYKVLPKKARKEETL